MFSKFANARGEPLSLEGVSGEAEVSTLRLFSFVKKRISPWYSVALGIMHEREKSRF